MTTDAGPGEIVKVGGQAMRRKNGEALAVSIDEGHHREFVSGVRIGCGRMSAALIAIVQGRLVAMMAICNDEFQLGHG